jgi:endogenous inhibitor of DNA gyrase (YacG/DUF329 family)
MLCPICDKYFEQIRKTKRFCSPKCRLINLRENTRADRALAGLETLRENKSEEETLTPVPPSSIATLPGMINVPDWAKNITITKGAPVEEPKNEEVDDIELVDESKNKAYEW